MKKIIEAKNTNFAKKSAIKYLEKFGFDTFASNLDRCITEPGHCERFHSPGKEAWVCYLGENKFQVEINN